MDDQRIDTLRDEGVDLLVLLGLVIIAVDDGDLVALALEDCLLYTSGMEGVYPAEPGAAGVGQLRQPRQAEPYHRGLDLSLIHI